VAASSESFAFQAMNVTQAADWQAAIEKAVQLWGKVDILVNNAGTSYPNKVGGLSRFINRPSSDS
jgi:NADP-dependent 3-hydroxy acid dehydrogenase YdfG